MHPKTRIRSTVMRVLASAGYLEAQRTRARLARRLRNEAPAVHYFHQVDDPYSHLAVQKLDLLKANYALPFHPHLVSRPADPYLGSSAHFDRWALRDALSIARDYGTTFEATSAPDAEAVQAANDVLAGHLQTPDFARAAAETGATLWAGDLPADRAQPGAGASAVARGNALRARLGHYFGGMFYFDGEWFWGIDRIRLLEQRLLGEGFGGGHSDVLVPEPSTPDTSGWRAGQVTLEYFPSLRSPYTAVGHPRVLDLIARTGVSVRLRPVMPMMMRGIPAPVLKQRYIITDAAREARARGVPFGRIVDPFGDPVRRAFALLPAASRQGRGMDFVTAYLRAAWADGVDITGEAGLRRVVSSAGIRWPDDEHSADDADWEAPLTDNLNDMLGAGLWGVPSFRVSGGNDPEPFACWGQDRIWRVAREIARRSA